MNGIHAYRNIHFGGIYLHKSKRTGENMSQEDKIREGGQPGGGKDDFGSGVPWRWVKSVAAAISLVSPLPFILTFMKSS